MGKFFSWMKKRTKEESTEPTIETQKEETPELQATENHIRKGLPDNFWTEIVYYPGTVSSAMLEDPGPQGQALRDDIKMYAKQRREWEAQYQQARSEHKVKPQ